MTDPPEARGAHRRVEARLLRLAAIIAAVGVVLGAVAAIRRSVDDATGPSWPETEYKKVRSLSVGPDISTYERLLGKPFVRGQSEVDPQPWRLHVFARPGWLALLTVDPDGQVSQWNVVACSKRFRPTFDDGGRHAKRSATLNVSTLTDVSSRLPDRSVRLPAAAASGTGYWEGDNYRNANGGNPRMWGVVAACSRISEPRIDKGLGWDCPDQDEHELSICPATGDDPFAERPFMKRLRATRPSWQTPVNMWGECSISCEYTVGVHLEIGRSVLQKRTQPP